MRLPTKNTELHPVCGQLAHVDRLEEDVCLQHHGLFQRHVLLVLLLQHVSRQLLVSPLQQHYSTV